MGLLAASLAIAMLPVTARVAKGMDSINDWPALKTMLHSQADSKAVTLNRGASLTLDASNAVLAPDLSVLQVDSVNDPTVVVPNNGVVDAADYTVWRDSLGDTGSDLPADGTGDGGVYRVDYTQWKTRFGESTGDSVVATVPEPASGTFLFSDWFGLLLVGRQPRLLPAG
jgi:hypothetical protein